MVLRLEVYSSRDFLTAVSLMTVGLGCEGLKSSGASTRRSIPNSRRRGKGEMLFPPSLGAIELYDEDFAETI